MQQVDAAPGAPQHHLESPRLWPHRAQPRPGAADKNTQGTERALELQGQAFVYSWVCFQSLDEMIKSAGKRK